MDILLNEENLILAGIAFGLLMCSGLIFDVVATYFRGEDAE